MPSLGDLDFSTPERGRDRSAAIGEIDGFLNANGLRHFSFVVTQHGNETVIDPTIELQTNYPRAWADRYCERRYDQIDPLVQRSRNVSNPIVWGSDQFLKSLDKRRYRFFMEAREFGVRCGISFPIRRADGSVGLVTYTAPDDDVLSDIVNERGARLWVAAHQIMDCLTDELPQGNADNPLSAREREALIWVAEGCTSEEIADRMFITSSAVNYHLGNATRKLGARNRHHATLMALKNKLI
ncbi:MAG: LuxR family transcriptional regulator [Pseudomonadota bacterium]